jgi:hypothetical protein
MFLIIHFRALQKKKKKHLKVKNREGGISPRINFSGQILSVGIPTKFFWTVLRKPTKFSGEKFVLPKIFGAFGAISFISYVFSLWAPEKNPPNFPGEIL